MLDYGLKYTDLVQDGQAKVTGRNIASKGTNNHSSTVSTIENSPGNLLGRFERLCQNMGIAGVSHVRICLLDRKLEKALS